MCVYVEPCLGRPQPNQIKHNNIWDFESVSQPVDKKHSKPPGPPHNPGLINRTKRRRAVALVLRYSAGGGEPDSYGARGERRRRRENGIPLADDKESTADKHMNTWTEIILKKNDINA